MLLTAYDILISIVWIAASIYLLIMSNRIVYLKNVLPAYEIAEPSVAVIIAVKDEEAEVEAALKSVCKLEYGNYKIIVVNDRSTDRTPEILHAMALLNANISVITVTEVPDGWLGKNHALYKGYIASVEQWLLFTDADVMYSSTALSKAINYALMHELDHLTVLPEITSPSHLFKSVVNTFAILLEMRLHPWNAINPASKASIGIGAFNLVKRSAYERAGTHKLISLRPDDDLKLGKAIKAAGLQQAVVYGEKEISLHWYTSLKEFVQGLMKNSFAVSNYNLPEAIGGAALIFLIMVIPIPILLLQGQAGLFMALSILASQIVLMLLKKGINGKWWHALMIPFAGAVMVFIILKSAFITLEQGGIYWRNTFYPLSELRKQK